MGIDYQTGIKVVYFVKLECSEATLRGIVYRDFVIPNTMSRFGIEKACLFIDYNVRQSSGAPTVCLIVELKVHSDFLRIMFALTGLWGGSLNTYTRVGILSRSIERLAPTPLTNW